MDSGVLCSIEVSIRLPVGEDLIERHEIIGQRGAVSDMVVDTLISQNSVYLLTEDQKTQFLDYDMELFEYSGGQIDLIRAAFEVVKMPALITEWRNQHYHLVKIIRAIHQSNAEIKKQKV